MLALVGGGLVALGSFLPWITATAAFLGTISRNGIDGGGDGIWTIVIGVIVVIGVVGGLSSPGAVGAARAAAVVGGIAAVVVGFLDMSDVQGRVNTIANGSSGAIASVGMGIYVVMLGGALAVVGGLVARSAPPAAAAAPAGAVAKRCPRCAEAVKLEARACRFCGYEFTAADDAALAAATAPVKASAGEGRWQVVQSSDRKLKEGATVFLRGWSDQLLVSTGQVSVGLARAKMSAEDQNGRLVLGDGAATVVLAPAEGQSPLQVASSLNASRPVA